MREQFIKDLNSFLTDDLARKSITKPKDWLKLRESGPTDLMWKTGDEAEQVLRYFLFQGVKSRVEICSKIQELVENGSKDLETAREEQGFFRALLWVLGEK